VHLPISLTWRAAALLERTWALTRRTDEPILTRYAVAQMARTCTLDLTRARNDLGYRPETDRHAVLSALAGACETAAAAD
jgi:hypothetical protein